MSGGVRRPLRVCHITPHLPPDQAANALLPAHLGQWMLEAGHEVSFVAHPPRQSRTVPLVPATYIPSRHRDATVMGSLKLASLVEAVRIRREAAPVIDRADVVHVHSNGLLAEAGGLLALHRKKPVVLTLYGTEVWHYAPKSGLDLFTRLYRRAHHVAFYSRGLLSFAEAKGLERPHLSVIYPPVADAFRPLDVSEQRAVRAQLGLVARHVLVNVKRLHPLAGQVDLIAAMPAVLSQIPDTHLVICGTGPLASELEARAHALGVLRHITFTGLIPNARVAQYVGASDLFVLPSHLEAMPTVAVEALASGIPVVTADHPGGVELHELFGDDVSVVPRGAPDRLAVAIVDRVRAERQASDTTRARVREHFSPQVVLERYMAVYERVIQPGKRA